MTIKLTIEERAQLRAALLGAFPTKGDLQQLTYLRMDETLEHVADGANYGQVVSNLIGWAESHDRTEELIRAARAMNPGNADLRAFEQAYQGRRGRIKP